MLNQETFNSYIEIVQRPFKNQTVEAETQTKPFGTKPMDFDSIRQETRPNRTVPQRR